jgi:hypothetical protein
LAPLGEQVDSSAHVESGRRRIDSESKGGRAEPMKTFRRI